MLCICVYNCNMRVCLDCLLVSCYTYICIIETPHKIKVYDVTFNSFIQWDFCAICMHCDNFKPHLSESQWNKSPCCTVLKNMCLQFRHYHTQNFEQKLMFLTGFVNNRQETHIRQYLEPYATNLYQTVQFTRNCMRIWVCKLNTIKISGQIWLTLRLNRLLP